MVILQKLHGLRGGRLSESEAVGVERVNPVAAGTIHLDLSKDSRGSGAESKDDLN